MLIMRKPFDPINSSLCGTNLIEASAGTGKTYTITALFLRLLLEAGLTVDQILVVTYTEAATAELKERIEARLREAFRVFSGKKIEDPFFETLLAAMPDPAEALSRIKNAIRSFDEAAIFTIHGFCLRLLQDHPFAGGNPFDVELTVRQDDFYLELADDFWRQQVIQQSPLFLSFLLEKNLGPEILLKQFRRYITPPEVVVLPDTRVEDDPNLENRFLEQYRQLVFAWQEHRQTVSDILLFNESLKRNRYKAASIPGLLDQMDAFCRPGVRVPIWFDRFEIFTIESIQAGTRKNHSTPEHDFFILCSQLQDTYHQVQALFEKKRIELKVSFFDYLREEGAKRKKARRFRSFDDLLLESYQALTSGSGARDLAESLQNRYKAALIDEFQDTDALQYAIFQKLFAQDSAATLFLIGDPKQAIYSFRGADIFAYMQATRSAEQQYTLQTNWRSSAALLQAINTIFSGVPNPFYFADIQYNPVQAAPAKAAEKDHPEPDDDAAPFVLWHLDGGDDNPISQQAAYQRIPRAVAAEIRQLLGDKRTLPEGRPVCGNDIAVLVRKNHEADLIREALAQKRIPAVIFSNESIFDSFEAYEMERVLTAIANPNRPDLVKSALTTEIMGFRSGDILRLMESEKVYEERLLNFQSYHTIWERNGFLPMFTQFSQQEGIQQRLMRYPDGERRYTNIRHLTELIHQAGLLEGKGITDLLTWLRKQRQPYTRQGDEHPLRLESDADAVRIVTIHKSKGLEYPIVFCPFTWSGSVLSSSQDLVAFHDPENSLALTLDLGSNRLKKHTAHAQNELLSENLRLFYVALTRAKYRCYLVWGRFLRAETSAPAYLFHFAEAWSSGAAVPFFKNIPDHLLLQDLEDLVRQSRGSIRLETMAEGPVADLDQVPKSEQPLSARRFQTKIPRAWRINSFSSLAHSQPEQGDKAVSLKTDDAANHYRPFSLESQEPAAERFNDFFSFPKGAVPGTCLHDILEQIDFTDVDSAASRDRIQNSLRRYGFQPEWEQAVQRMVRNLTSTRLDTSRPFFSLSQVPFADRISELEFHFPTRAFHPYELSGVFQTYAAQTYSENLYGRLSSLGSTRIQGFMKGFVDLVFFWNGRYYIIDWKSNHLGSRIEDYCLPRIQEVMENELYVLQYLLYTVALDRYLSLRILDYDYETHFGGVFYLFLRAFGKEHKTDAGIYYNRPDRLLVTELTNLLRQPGTRS